MDNPPGEPTPAPQSSSWEGWQRYLLLSALALLLLGGVGWTAFSASNQLRRTLNEVIALQEATKELALLLQLTVDLEGGQRGYLLTGDESYLAPYQNAEAAVQRQLDVVNESLQGYSEAAEELAAIRRSLAMRRADLATSIRLYREEGPKAALDQMRQHLGREAMEDIRAAIRRVSVDARSIIVEKQASIEDIITSRNITIFWALAMAVAASLAGVVLLRRHLRALAAEERLRAEKDRSDRASREKSIFLANMSHEIRTPMNAIFGFSQLLAERVTDPEQRRYVDAIVTSGRSLLALINDVLDLSKIEAGRLDVKAAPMSLRETIDSVVLVFSQFANEKGLRLAARVDSSVPEGLELDQARLRRMLFNLVGNAVKYTDEGHVLVRAALPDGDDETRLTCLIEIEDTGIGIDPSDHERIFDPFAQAQTSTPREGTGLGLDHPASGAPDERRGHRGQHSRPRLVFPAAPGQGGNRRAAVGARADCHRAGGTAGGDYPRCR
ncbi:CHASE3 domain-containing protein [Paucibacter sp. O1-1]|nr:CHASE3 domain-containing protein [Paucibacter sp. O1-1]MDA3831412.1 CHASE3 domain-containing protein [Paucibacter sp. O1-1]